MNDSLIEWTSKTWNPITGCPGPKVSPGCAHCYAERTAKTRLAGRYGYDADDPFGIHIHDERWLQPLKAKKPQRIFVCSMGDLFHKSVSLQYVAKAFAVMAMCPQHTFLLLTKREDRMEQFVSDTSTLANDRRGVAYQEIALAAGRYRNMDGLRWPLPNVWLGVTVCTPDELRKLETLRGTPAVRRFVSFEPLLADLGAVNLSGIDWVICGGETGSKARPAHPDWFRNLRDQCQGASVPFFFKNWGNWIPVEFGCDDKKYLSCEPDGIVAEDGRFGDYTKEGDTEELWDEGGAACLAKKTRIIKSAQERYGRLLDGREWNEVPS